MQKTREDTKKREYEAFKKITRMQVDKMRVVFDIKPEEEDTQEMPRKETRNNYKVKFEKFKQWVKENGFALSGVIIGVGGIIAVVATAFRTTVQTVARGTYAFGKGAAKILTKIGTIFSA